MALFEVEAAGGNAKAKYSSGVAHLYGHGVPRNPSLAAEWFSASALPEGLHAVALYHQANGRGEEAARWSARAERMGLSQPWRQAAKERSRQDGLHM